MITWYWVLMATQRASNEDIPALVMFETSSINLYKNAAEPP